MGEKEKMKDEASESFEKFQKFIGRVDK